MKIVDLFSGPKLIGVVGDVNSAKSNFLYHIIEELKKVSIFKLYTYGLKSKMDNAIEIFSVGELESIENSIVIIDEVMTMWDLDNRKEKKSIENTLRVIHHNNNIVVLCMLPENCKKFIASKLTITLYKKCTLTDFINGSKTKKIISNYRGIELGTSILNLAKDKVLIFDNKHYYKLDVPYYEQYDSKKENISILNLVNQTVPKSVPKIEKNKNDN